MPMVDLYLRILLAVMELMAYSVLLPVNARMDYVITACGQQLDYVYTVVPNGLANIVIAPALAEMVPVMMVLPATACVKFVTLVTGDPTVIMPVPVVVKVVSATTISQVTAFVNLVTPNSGGQLALLTVPVFVVYAMIT